MTQNVSFTGPKEYAALVRDVKDLTSVRFYDSVKNGVYNGLTKDEFYRALPITQEAAIKKRKEFEDMGFKVTGDSIAQAMELLKNKFSF